VHGIDFPGKTYEEHKHIKSTPKYRGRYKVDSLESFQTEGHGLVQIVLILHLIVVVEDLVMSERREQHTDQRLAAIQKFEG